MKHIVYVSHSNPEIGNQRYDAGTEAMARFEFTRHLSSIRDEYDDSAERYRGKLKVTVEYPEGRTKVQARARIELTGTDYDGWSTVRWEVR